MDMKKIYIAPEIETINCMPCSVILDGSPLKVDDSGKQFQDGSDSPLDGEATGSARGDWNNIWEGL